MHLGFRGSYLNLKLYLQINIIIFKLEKHCFIRLQACDKTVRLFQISFFRIARIIHFPMSSLVKYWIKYVLYIVTKEWFPDFFHIGLYSSNAIGQNPTSD